MIIFHTTLKSIDNSGAVLSKCIKLLGGFNKKNSYTGDIMLVNICTFKKKPKIKKKKLYLGIVLRTKSYLYRYTGFSLKYDTNYILHINKDKVPIATRILGSVPKELRYRNFIKIVSMCKKVI